MTEAIPPGECEPLRWFSGLSVTKHLRSGELGLQLFRILTTFLTAEQAI